MKEIVEELRADLDMLCETWLSRAMDVPGFQKLVSGVSRNGLCNSASPARRDAAERRVAAKSACLALKARLKDAAELFLDGVLSGSLPRGLTKMLDHAVGRAPGLGLTTANLIRLVHVGEEIVLKRLLTVRAGTAESRAEARSRVRSAVDIAVLAAVGRAEDGLAGESRKLRGIIEATGVGLFRATPDRRFIALNATAARLLGFETVEEAMTVSCAEFAFAEDLERAHNTLSSRGVLSGLRIRFIRADGETRWGELNCSGVFDAEGSLIEIDGFFTDVTERVQAEEALRRTEESYRRLIENSQDIAYSADTRGVITFCSPQAAKYGIDPAKVVGRPFAEFIHPDDVEHVASDIETTLTTGKIFPSYFRIRRADGSYFHVEEFGGPIYEDGEVVGITGVIRDITERRLSEERLHESEEKWRSLVQNAPDVIMTVDLEGKILFVNRTVPGLKPESTIGTFVYDYIPPEYHDAQRACIRRVFETGKPESYELAGTGPDGSLAWYVSRIGPIKRGDEVVAVNIISTDVTDQKRAAEALRESEKRYKALVESASDTIFTVSPDGVFLSVNAAAASGLGRRAEEIVGKHMRDLFPKEVADRQAEGVRRTFESGVTSTSAFSKTVTALGQRWYSTTLTPVKEPGGTGYVLGISRDVTAQKSAEQALRESEEKYHSIFTASPDIIYLLDPDGRIIDANKALLDRLGLTLEQLKGANAFDFLRSDKLDAVREAGEKLKRGEPVRGLELVAGAASGRSYVYEINAIPLRDSDGLVIGSLNHARDVTERKELEARLLEQERRHYENLEREVRERTRELEEANRELRRLDDMKDQFLANVSHELRTPLVSGIGYIELMLQGGLGPIGKEARRGLEISHRNLNRLVTLIEDLLAYARLQSGRETLVMEPFDIEHVIDGCLLDLKVRAGKKSLKLAKEIEPGLPYVYADEDKIHRVLTNLLSNAEKFTGDEAEIRVEARRSGDRVEIAVADNGPGIPPEMRDKVFERFIRGKARVPGTGIGLSLVRQIVRAHNCDVEILPNPTGGTRVVFTLDAAVSRKTPPPGQLRAVDGSPGGTTMRTVLVVDDDEDVLQLLSKALSPTYRVLTAASGEEALKAVREKHPDILLLDVALGQMSGFDVLHELKSGGEFQPIPVYMVSAHGSDRAVREARDAGADGFITKPFSVSRILDTIRTALGVR